VTLTIQNLKSQISNPKSLDSRNKKSLARGKNISQPKLEVRAMINKFRDRAQAGQMLAQKLAAYNRPEVIVLGLPRGGVPVAYEIAKALQVPLDVCMFPVELQR
jgi:adenine/guanine phosphoribosyltransferase-like PRPP-binding protein